MAGVFKNMQDKTRDIVSSIGAMQTLVEKFPMNLISLDNINYACSFDLLKILLDAVGSSKEELVEMISEVLTEGVGEDVGFINDIEDAVKYTIEANLVNVLNCTTDPIISDDLIYHKNIAGTDIKTQGDGIYIDLSEIDMNGTLRRNPCAETSKNYFFDVAGYTPSDVYKSTDFNAFLWWVINKGDASQYTSSTWDNRCVIKKKKNKSKKNIVTCTYFDEHYPKNDVIRVHLSPDTYYKTRKIKVGDLETSFNKTIFEFNHDFLHSIKLFDAKVILSEMSEYLFGGSNFAVNFGVSLDDRVIKEKIDQMIDKVIKESDMGTINDCFFSFNNEEYNEMVEKAEQKRFNVINTGSEFVQCNPMDAINKLTGITENSSLEENKTVISDILYDITATPAKDPEVEIAFNMSYDWQTELLRMLVYPLVRPLFSPKILFLLAVNKKIMGSVSLEDIGDYFANIMTGLWNIIKDVIVKVKDMLVELLFDYVMKKLKPLLELFASRLLAETLKTYKDLLMQLLESCAIGWNNNGVIGNIDNVNYADIEETQIVPEQSIC